LFKVTQAACVSVEQSKRHKTDVSLGGLMLGCAAAKP
jgi:hypothetical protein